jgi:hypothetical protein
VDPDPSVEVEFVPLFPQPKRTADAIAASDSHASALRMVEYYAFLYQWFAHPGTFCKEKRLAELASRLSSS